MGFSPERYSSISCLVLNNFYKYILHLICVLCLVHCSQGDVQICQSVRPPILHGEPENCSLVCSLKFQHAVSSTSSDEITLCIKNSSLAVFCVNHNDCRRYHVGAYCKIIPCLCRAKSGPPEAYIFDSFFGAQKINTCVVSAKYVNPNQPIVPFPWNTLLLVCAIVFVFAALLICLRWVSPLIRSMRAKRSARNNRERQTAPTEDNASLFPPVNQQTDSTPFSYYIPQGLPRIYRASPRRSQRNHRSSSRARYTSCAQAEASPAGTLSKDDKPPPYETAIQLPPPAYEDVERAINENRRPTSNSGEISDQRVEVHASSENTTTVQPHVSSASHFTKKYNLTFSLVLKVVIFMNDKGKDFIPCLMLLYYFI